MNLLLHKRTNIDLDYRFFYIFLLDCNHFCIVLDYHLLCGLCVIYFEFDSFMDLDELDWDLSFAHRGQEIMGDIQRHCSLVVCPDLK